MESDVRELLEQLIDYFKYDKHEDEYPVVSVYSKGKYHQGIIDEELMDILRQAYVLLNEYD